MEMEDPVPVITRKHFEEALNHARTSVTGTDLARFEVFRKKYDPVYAASSTGSAVRKINWPEDNSS
jgi:transitional endoplasmic reticulum ATPase